MCAVERQELVDSCRDTGPSVPGNEKSASEGPQWVGACLTVKGPTLGVPLGEGVRFAIEDQNAPQISDLANPTPQGSAVGFER